MIHTGVYDGSRPVSLNGRDGSPSPQLKSYEKFLNDIQRIEKNPDMQSLESVLGKKIGLVNVSPPLMKNMLQFLVS
jgi:hypothetical protein